MNIKLTHRAAEDFDKLQRAQPRLFNRIAAKIRHLSIEPRLGKSLVGPLKGKFSLRIGDYRVIYQIERETITILTINHRKEVYR